MTPDAVTPRVRRPTLIVAAVAVASSGALAVLQWPSPDRALHVTTEYERGVVHTHVTGNDVDVTDLPLADLIGVGLTGRADVAADLRVPLGDGERDYREATGDIRVSCADCTTALEVGPLSFGRVDARMTIAGGKATVTGWKVASPDLRLDLALDIQLAKRLDDSTVSGCVRFAATDALRARDPKLATLLDVTGAAKGADGL